MSKEICSSVVTCTKITFIFLISINEGSYLIPLSYQKREEILLLFTWCLVLSKILIVRVKISCPSCCMGTRDNTRSK
jgi:hypothetical protein